MSGIIKAKKEMVGNIGELFRIVYKWGIVVECG